MSDPISHANSRSCEACCKLLYLVYLTFLTFIVLVIDRVSGEECNAIVTVSPFVFALAFEMTNI